MTQSIGLRGTNPQVVRGTYPPVLVGGWRMRSWRRIRSFMRGKPLTLKAWTGGRGVPLLLSVFDSCQHTRGAGVAGQAGDRQAVALVAGAVADAEALACDHPAVQRQILAVVTNVTALAGAAMCPCLTPPAQDKRTRWSDPTASSSWPVLCPSHDVGSR